MDIQQTIKERFAQLPVDIQKAITSSDLPSKFNKIADKHGLRVDQNGSLQTETLLVMLGLEPADDYVDNMQRELEVSRSEAQAIAEDVNLEILYAVKSSLRKIEEDGTTETTQAPTSVPAPVAPVSKPAPTVPSLNMINTAPFIPPAPKAPDFIVEKRPQSASPLYNDSTLKKENVLNDLENIEKLKPQNASNFVEHLLANPVSKPTQVETKKIQSSPPASKSTVDPYREQV